MPAMKRAAAVRANRIVVAKFALGARTRRGTIEPILLLKTGTS
jgi:hypothetical protein